MNLRTAALILIFLTTLCFTSKANDNPNLFGVSQVRGGVLLSEFNTQTNLIENLSINRIDTDGLSNFEGVILDNSYFFMSTDQFGSPTTQLKSINLSTGEESIAHNISSSQLRAIVADPCSETLIGLGIRNSMGAILVGFNPNTESLDTISQNPIPFFENASSFESFLNGDYYFKPRPTNQLNGDRFISCVDVNTGEIIDTIETPDSDYQYFISNPSDNLIYGLITSFNAISLFSLEVNSETFSTISPSPITIKGDIQPNGEIVDGVYYFTSFLINQQFLYAIDINSGSLISETEISNTTINFLAGKCECNYDIFSGNPIPTMSEWSIIVLSLLFLIISVVSLKVFQNSNISAHEYY